MPIVLNGPAARLMWGYHEAASLGPWTIADGTVTAKILTVDAYRMTQHPLTLVVPYRNWRWALSELQIANGTLTARLGSLEESHAVSVCSA